MSSQNSDSQNLYSAEDYHQGGGSSEESSSEKLSSEGVPLAKAFAAVRAKAQKSDEVKLMGDAMKSAGKKAGKLPDAIPVFPGEKEPEEGPSKTMKGVIESPKKKGGRLKKPCIKYAYMKKTAPRLTRQRQAELDAAMEKSKKKKRQEPESVADAEPEQPAPSKKAKKVPQKEAPTAPKTGKPQSEKKKKKAPTPITIESEDDASDAGHHFSNNQGTHSPAPSRRSSYVPQYRSSYHARFWSVNKGKNIISECPVNKDVLIECGLWEYIMAAGLESTVIPVRRFVSDLVLEFYTNLSKDMFEEGSVNENQAFIRGETFVFSAAVVDTFLGRTPNIEEDADVDFDLVAEKLTGGKFKTWHARGVFTCAELSMKYSILHKILLKNWYPGGHKTTVGRNMGVVLFKIGEKRPLNFGKVVMNMLREHAEKTPCKKPIVFPGLITAIITKCVDVLTPEDVYSDVPKMMILNSKLFDEATHINDLPREFGGRRKKLAEKLVAESASVAAKMKVMSGQVISQLHKEYDHLSKIIKDCTFRRAEIESLLRSLQDGQADNEEGPSGAKDGEGREQDDADDRVDDEQEHV